MARLDTFDINRYREFEIDRESWLQMEDTLKTVGARVDMDAEVSGKVFLRLENRADEIGRPPGVPGGFSPYL